MIIGYYPFLFSILYCMFRVFVYYSKDKKQSDTFFLRGVFYFGLVLISIDLSSNATTPADYVVLYAGAVGLTESFDSFIKFYCEKKLESPSYFYDFSWISFFLFVNLVPLFIFISTLIKFNSIFIAILYGIKLIFCLVIVVFLILLCVS